MAKIKEIQIRCIKCDNITKVNRDCPEKAISMESDRCPECTDLLGHYLIGSWKEWYIDKDGNKFN